MDEPRNFEITMEAGGRAGVPYPLPARPLGREPTILICSRSWVGATLKLFVS